MSEISIIVPIHPKDLPHASSCLESIAYSIMGIVDSRMLAQCYTHIRPDIVVDGPVSDESRTALKRLVEGVFIFASGAECAGIDICPRITFLKETVGPGEARNVLLADAPGVAMFLDVDDIWYPWTMREHATMHTLHANKEIFVYGESVIQLTDEKGAPIRHIRPPVGSKDLAKVTRKVSVVSNGCWSAQADSIRKAGGFDTEVRAKEQWPLLQTMFENGVLPICRVVPMYCFRYSPKGQGSTMAPFAGKKDRNGGGDEVVTIDWEAAKSRSEERSAHYSEMAKTYGDTEDGSVPDTVHKPLAPNAEIVYRTTISYKDE